MHTTDARPVFPGTLTVETGAGGRPYLLVTHRCPACRGHHTHTWPGTLDDTPTPRAAHCWRDSSPYRHPHGHGYLVHPAPTPANRATFARYLAQLADHERAGRRAGAAAAGAVTGATAAAG